MSATSNSRRYVSGDFLKEVDASETQPLFASAPHTISLKKGGADLFSEDGKSAINSTWNPQTCRSTSPSSVLGRRKMTIVVGSTTMLLSLAAIWFLTLRNGLLCRASPSNPYQLVKENPPPEVQHSWGAYTPYFSVEPYILPPPNCRISQVR